MNKFLLKVNEDDENCVKYFEESTGRFECGHYFAGLRIAGGRFMSSGKEIQEEKFENMTTILTKEELKRLFEFDEKVKKLGYGINEGDERYKKGLQYRTEIQDIIDKLNGEDNKKLFEKVQDEEREVLKNMYDLTDEDIDYIFNNYTLEYRDRSIIAFIWEDIDECANDEAISLGYVNGYNDRYFDYETFKEDLLDDTRFLELSDGRIVMLNY